MTIGRPRKYPEYNGLSEEEYKRVARKLKREEKREDRAKKTEHYIEIPQPIIPEPLPSQDSEIVQAYFEFVRAEKELMDGIEQMKVWLDHCIKIRRNTYMKYIKLRTEFLTPKPEPLIPPWEDPNPSSH